MQKQSGRKVLADVSNGAERIEFRRLIVWIDASHRARPKTVLAAVAVKQTPMVRLPHLRNHVLANGAGGFLVGNHRQRTIERIRLRIPRSRDVTVAVE